MSELKTKASKASVRAFLAAVRDTDRRRDCQTLLALMEDVTGERPTMWGSSIVGFGQYHYRSQSGQEGDWFLTGFSPRKDNLTVYVMGGLKEHGPLLKKLGKHKTSGGSCVYIKKLEEIHIPSLRTLVRRSVAATRARYPKQTS